MAKENAKKFIIIDSFILFFIGKMELPQELKTSLLETMAANPYLQLGEKFSTYYHVEKHVQSSSQFRYIEPQQIPLENSDKKFTYISVIDTISMIVTDPTFRSGSPQNDGLLRDVKDGAAYKENPFFSANPEAFTLMLYSDALELCNPLGPRKTVHKIVNVYFTIAELPKHLRSKTENIFLILSVKEKDLQEFRQAVYQSLLTDLAKLEKGVVVGGQIIKVDYFFAS
jgi:hypothetical protein